MGDMGDDFRVMHKAKKERHAEMHKKNTAILNKSGLKHRKISHECYCFREQDLKVDFYPSTGRWRDQLTGKVYKGGAHNLIGWLANRRKRK